MASSTGTPLLLQASPVSGAAPLAVMLSLSVIPTGATIQLDSKGNGTNDFSGISLDGQVFTYTQPGTYVPTATITDAQGNQFTAQAMVQVVDRTALDASLRAKWTALKDAETRQPGRLNGPLMVLGAVSGADGVLSFPGWGPLDGPLDGLGMGRDPVITPSKSGYKGLLINNGAPPATTETQRVRRFGQEGRTYTLERFKGAPQDWVKELERVYAGVAVPRSDDQAVRFRDAYLNRLRRVWSERASVPPALRRERDFFWFVEKRMKFLQEGHR